MGLNWLVTGNSIVLLLVDIRMNYTAQQKFSAKYFRAFGLIIKKYFLTTTLLHLKEAYVNN